MALEGAFKEDAEMPRAAEEVEKVLAEKKRTHDRNASDNHTDGRDPKSAPNVRHAGSTTKNNALWTLSNDETHRIKGDK